MSINSNSTYVVTGAAGFIGSHLCFRLLNEGKTVVGIDNFDPFYSRELKEKNLNISLNNNPGFKFFEGHFADSKIWDEIFKNNKNVDCVIHLAAHAGVRPSIERPLDYYDNNVTSFVKLLEILRSHPETAIVFASSSSVYGSQKETPFSEEHRVDDPRSPYAATKKSGEEILSTFAFLYGLRAASMRLFTVYGPRQRPDLALRSFYLALSKGNEITLFGDGSTFRDYTFVEDIVNGLVLGSKYLSSVHSGYHDVFNLGCGSPVTLMDMVKTLSNAMKVEPKLKFAPRHPADVERTWAKVDKAHKTFGYEPKVHFSEGVRRFVEYNVSS